MPAQGHSAPSNTQHREAAPKPQVGAMPEPPQTHIRAGWSHAAGGSGESCGSLGRESESVNREEKQGSDTAQPHGHSFPILQPLVLTGGP